MASLLAPALTGVVLSHWVKTFVVFIGKPLYSQRASSLPQLYIKLLENNFCIVGSNPKMYHMHVFTHLIQGGVVQNIIILSTPRHLYVSVTNTKAYATLVTEHILFCLCIVIFLFSFKN